jgi:EAL domain-containing protein (putative c-di-GMP-specific phosphodiesterase class I)
MTMVVVSTIPQDRVVVVHVEPELAPDRLVPICFAAASAAFGSQAIADIADGPRGSALLHLTAAAPRSQAAARTFREGMEARLAAEPGAMRRLRVEALDRSTGAGAVVREMALEWVERAGPDAFLSSRGNAYDAAVGELLTGDQMRMLFQPIVEAWSGRVVGFEALCRGPVGHLLEMPDAFFDALGRSTLQAQVHLRLIELARRRAAAALPSPDMLLFINVPAEDHWPSSRGGNEATLLPLDTWPWSKVVLEVTEKAPIRNQNDFATVLDWGRKAGVRWALDDVGAGYAGLSSYALLQPEFTKIDMGLVRGCDPTRRAIIASLVTLAHRTGSQVIAEGVESVAELETVRWAGADLVQGFLVAHPTEAPAVTHYPQLAATSRRKGLTGMRQSSDDAASVVPLRARLGATRGGSPGILG